MSTTSIDYLAIHGPISVVRSTRKEMLRLELGYTWSIWTTLFIRRRQHPGGCSTWWIILYPQATIDDRKHTSLVWCKFISFECKKKSFLLIFYRIGKNCPTVTEIQTSKGFISHPADRFARFIGVHLDENLFFKWHINSMRLKVSRGLGIIRKLKQVFPFSILHLLYFSLTYPYICCCSSVVDVYISLFPYTFT